MNRPSAVHSVAEEEEGPDEPEGAQARPVEAVAADRATPAWLTAGPVVVCTVLVSLAALWPTVASLGTFWRGIRDYQQYGFLISAIALAWIFMALRPIWRAPVKPSMWGTATLAAMLGVWLIAVTANSQMAHQLLLPAIVWTAAFATAGWATARRLLLPMAFLYFAVPLWEHLVPALRWLSVHATEGLLGVVGVPARMSEYRVTIPEGTFQIVDGCSGKRYFMVSLAVGVLATAVNGISGWRRILFVAIAGTLALLANWIRIVVVIYAGHVTNMQHYFVAVEHLTLGNVIFVVLLLAIFFLAHKMGSRPARSGSGLMPGETRAAFAPSNRYPWRIVAPLLLLGVVMVLGLVRAVASASPSALGPLPVAVGAWLGPYPPSPLWHPLFVSPDREVRAAYTSGAGPIEIYVNAYGEQKQGAELVSWGNTFLAPGGWKEAWPPRSKPIAGQLNSFEARGPLGGLWLIAYTFQVGGTMTHSEMTAQLTYGVKSILHPVPAGVVALAARCDLNCEAAQVLVESFWGDMSGSLLAMIPARRPVVAIR